MSDARRHLRDLQRGDVLTAEQRAEEHLERYTTVRSKLEQLQHRAEELTSDLADREWRLRDLTRAADGHAQAAIDAEQELTRLQQLVDSERDRSSTSARAHRRELKEAAARASRAAAERDQTNQQLADAKARIDELEAQALRVDDESLRARTASEDHAHDIRAEWGQLDVDQLAPATRQRLADVHAISSVPTGGDAGAGSPEPGDPWPYLRGAQDWTLSRANRAMHSSTGRNLASDIGDQQAAETVGRFLAIRPSGGRVWVDDQGGATTYVDGRLTYLGRIGAVAAALTPGEVMDTPPPGRPGYTLRKGDVEERRSGRLLSDVIGSERAEAVSARLRQARASGGRVWCRPDGQVSTRVGNAHIFLGVVSANEWFGDTPSA